MSFSVVTVRLINPLITLERVEFSRGYIRKKSISKWTRYSGLFLFCICSENKDSFVFKDDVKKIYLETCEKETL